MRRIVIYPHEPYKSSNGGIKVQYCLAKSLKESGFNVVIVNKHGEINNEFFNDYINKSDFNNYKDCALYCEGVKGNPLGASNVIRWILSELGQNVPYKYVNNWGNEKIYFYGSELRFKNKPEFKDKIYKCLVFLHTNTEFKNMNLERNGSCHTFRKCRIHESYNIIHPKNSLEIKDLKEEEYINIFNRCEKFYCYDPITYLNILASLCGCITIVHPIKDYSKENWLRRTHYWEYLEKRNLGTNLYGVAYGLDDLDFAKKTIHLVKKQQEDMNNYYNTNAIESLRRDLNDFDNLENTLQKTYFDYYNTIQFNLNDIIHCVYSYMIFPLKPLDITDIIKNFTLQNKYYLKVKNLIPDLDINIHKKLIIKTNNDIFHYHENDIIFLNVGPKYKNIPTDTNLTFFDCKSAEMSGKLLESILRLKDSFWKYGQESQIDYFDKFYLHPQDHFIASMNNKIIGYCISRFSGNCFIIDTLIVDEKFRGIGIGKTLIQKILEKNNDGRLILISETKNINFYKKLGFVILNNFNFIDKEIKDGFVVLGININLKDNIEYYSNNLISNGIFGGITMVSINHLKFLVNYIIKNDVNKIVELGVSKGGVLAICSFFKNIKIYGFDLWDKIPKLTNDDDFEYQGYENLDFGKIEEVYKTFKIMNTNLNNTKLIKGPIENTLDLELSSLNKIDILRIDLNWYSSTKYSLEKLYDKVSTNGLVIVDGCFNIGCEKAINEFRCDKKINSPIFKSDEIPYLVYWFKD